MSQVLIIEDNLDTGIIIQSFLERAGYDSMLVTDGLTGLHKARSPAVSLIILDWMLPQLDGLELLKQLRQTNTVPIIMLSARTEEYDRILGLEFGADDYVTKPFSPGELVARVRALLRRNDDYQAREVQVLGKLRLDNSKRSAYCEDRLLSLTTLEFNLLYHLMQFPERVFSRDELLHRIWGADYTGVDRVVDVHMSNLRQKLKPDCSNCVITIRGVGYKLVCEV